VVSIALHMDKKVICGHVYHPLQNKPLDKLFSKVRGRFGAENIAMNNTLRRIVELKQENKQFILGFIADQAPNWNGIRHWIDFLRQDTPVFSGPERLACQTKSIVYYLDIKRPKRGYYQCEFIPITTTPQALPEYALTDMYFQLLEETIRRSPQYWLWSHNRWKRQRK
jgi:KDO2-lipid IV(A) lauroyltransferase